MLTAGKINGSSVGMYHELLYGKTQQDPSLLAGEPRAIRSDEWGVVTPGIVSQVREHFPMINKDFGHGQDVAVSLDVPYKDWSTLFKPQNWSFFVMPLAYAFAFKWWLLGVMLILAGYFFILSLLPGKYLIASLLASSLFFSPFVQWWYQSITLLPIAYSLLAAALIVHICKRPERQYKRLLLAAALCYTLTCFVFILYVPFIVPLAIVTAAYLIGHIINGLPSSNRLQSIYRLCPSLILPTVISLGLVAIFTHSHTSVVQAISNSVYPGHRVEQSGGFSWQQLFGGYYNIQLQSDAAASHLNLNQSEGSNFILLFPFLLPLLVYAFRKRRTLKLSWDWRIILLCAVVVLFLIRLFVPSSEIIFNLLQFNRIPHDRLLIGLANINIFLIVIAVQYFETRKPKLPYSLIRLSTILACLVVAAVGISYKLDFKGYVESRAQIIAISLLFGVVVWLFMRQRIVLACLVFLCFSAVSTIHINPLYRGLGVLTNSTLTHTLSRIGDADGRWVVGDNAASFESLPTATGLEELSGVYAYPQLSIWRGIGSDPATKAVYNRYAHVFFSVEPLKQPAEAEGSYFDPPALDAFRIHTDPCSIFLKDQRVRYVLQTVPLTSSCSTKIATIVYPEITFSIYKLTP